MFKLKYNEQNKLSITYDFAKDAFSEPILFIYLQEIDKFFVKFYNHNQKKKDSYDVTNDLTDYIYKKNFEDLRGLTFYPSSEMTPLIEILYCNSIKEVEHFLITNDFTSNFIIANESYLDYYGLDGYFKYSIKRIQCDCQYFDKKYFSLAKVKTNVVASGCLCGYIVVYDVEKNICLGKFKNEENGNERTLLIRAMTHISKNIIAVANSQGQIKLWKIMDSDETLNPICLHVFHGPNATYLHKDDQKNILYAGGEDGYTSCYNLDYPLIDQWNLRFVNSKNKNEYRRRQREIEERQKIRIENEEEEFEEFTESNDMYKDYYLRLFNKPYGIDQLAVYKIFQNAQGHLFIINFEGSLSTIETRKKKLIKKEETHKPKKYTLSDYLTCDN